ncbi:hypothetical protein D3C72_1560120 [compost metagenome]
MNGEAEGVLAHFATECRTIQILHMEALKYPQFTRHEPAYGGQALQAIQQLHLIGQITSMVFVVPMRCIELDLPLALAHRAPEHTFQVRDPLSIRPDVAALKVRGQIQPPFLFIPGQHAFELIDGDINDILGDRQRSNDAEKQGAFAVINVLQGHSATSVPGCRNASACQSNASSRSACCSCSQPFHHSSLRQSSC